MQPYSQLRDLKRASFVEQLPLASPWSMHVELTNRCNFKCKFCPESMEDYSERVGGISAITFDDFRKICDDILHLGRLKVLRFYMLGEPFLHKELPEMIAYAKERNVTDRIEVTSNATAITRSNAQRIIDSGLDYLRVSIYAIDPAKHKSITQSEIKPEHIRNNIKALWDLRNSTGATKPFIYVKTIDPYDKVEEQAFRDSYKDICDEIEVESPMNWDNPEGVDFLDNVYAENDDFDRKKLFANKKEVCPFPFYTLVVHSSGDVSVCCVDWEKKTVVGNIFKETLADIWHGERLRDFQAMQIDRRRHENPACKNCTFLHITPDNLDSITDIRQLYPDASPVRK